MFHENTIPIKNVVVNCALLSLFIFYAIHSNPGWIKYPDSQYYLEIARAWSNLNIILDDGTGTFVRPIAFLIYGIGYALGGFSGIHLLNILIAFLAIKFSLNKAKNSIIQVTLTFAIITTGTFAIYANSILLQIIGFGYVLFVLTAYSIEKKSSYSEALPLNLLLIIGIFIHGGILFLWVSYLVTLIIINFSIYSEKPYTQLIINSIKSTLLFLMLIFCLIILELIFSEKVFKSFVAEKGFKNTPELYYFGKFFLIYFEKIIQDLGMLGWSILILFVISLIRNIKKIYDGSKPMAYSIWLLVYLVIFEFMTLIGIMKRDPAASEYYRTYFMSYPLLILVSTDSAKLLFNGIKKKIKNKNFQKNFLHLFSITFLILILSTCYKNLKILNSRLDLSPFMGAREILLNNSILPNNKDLLLIPSNIYTHRRFFMDNDFLGNRAKYYYDVCSISSFSETIQNFNYIYLVKNERLLDKRIDKSLIDKGANCNPYINYYEILNSNGYSMIIDSESGTFFKRNEKN